MALGVLGGSDMLTRLLTLAALLVASGARAETIYVDDPLSALPKGSAGVVVGNKGGTFSASG